MTWRPGPGRQKHLELSGGDPRPLFDVGCRSAGVFIAGTWCPPGGKITRRSVKREQWNDGKTTAGAQPGVVVGYDRNDDTQCRHCRLRVLKFCGRFPVPDWGRGRGGGH